MDRPWLSGAARRALHDAYSAASRQRRRGPGQCVVCAAPFVGLRSKRTCSQACRQRAYRQRHPSQGRPTPEPWLPRPGTRVRGPRGLVGMVLRIPGDSQYTRTHALVVPDAAPPGVHVRVPVKDLRPA
jgi:hypothetical protein